MKRIFTILSIVAVAIAMCACESKEDITPNDNGGNQPEQNDPEQSNPEQPEQPEQPGEGEWENHVTSTYTHGFIEFWGQGYEDQPTDVANWCIILGSEGFDYDEWSGGESIVLELFTTNTSATSVPSGTYTVEAFLEENYSNFSVGDGFIATEENEDGVEESYCMGTWYYVDGIGEYAATSGSVTVAKDGDNYTVTYNLVDEEYSTQLTGSYKGALEYIDFSDVLSLSATKAAVRGGRKLPKGPVSRR